MYDLFNDVAMPALLQPMVVSRFPVMHDTNNNNNNNNNIHSLRVAFQTRQWSVDPQGHMTTALKTVNSDSPSLKEFLKVVDDDADALRVVLLSTLKPSSATTFNGRKVSNG